MGGFKRRLLATEDGCNRATALGEAAARGDHIASRCNRCGHSAYVAAAELIDRFGPAMPVPEIGAALPCPGCGTHDIATAPARPAASVHAPGSEGSHSVFA